MKYYFGGAEIKAWRELLIQQQVPTVSLSYVGLKRRLNTSNTWDIGANYPNSQQVFLDSGAYSLNKNPAKYTIEQAQELLDAYIEFVNENIAAVAMVSEFDAQMFGQDTLDTYRTTIYNDIPPEKFMPIWHPDYGTEKLESLCSAYDVVGVTIPDIHDTSLVPLFNSAISRYDVRLHGVAITSKTMMKEVGFDSVSSMSWLSPSVFGDTIVWNGKELIRYPKAYKNSRKRHRTLFRDIGLDEQKIEADDSKELLKLSIWSWQQFVNSLGRVTTMSSEQKDPFGHLDGSVVDIHPQDDRNEQLLPTVVEKRETQIIPVMCWQFLRSSQAEQANQESRDTAPPS